MMLRLRVRTTTGGGGKVLWKTAEQEMFPATGQAVEFDLRADEDWQELNVHLPVKDAPAIVRLYLPADQAPVDIRTLEFIPDEGQPQIWNFGR